MSTVPRLKQVALAAIPLIVFLAIWQAYVQVGSVDPSILPSPIRIARATINSGDVLAQDAWRTLVEAALGLALAMVAGCVLGVLIDASQLLRRTIYPPLVVSQTIPMIALAPLLVIWFGFGMLPKVLVVALVTFFPIAVAAADGLASTEPDTVRLLLSMGARRAQIFWKARVPQSLPYLFSGLKIAITYGVVGAIFGEYVGAYQGLGILMQTAKNSNQIDLVFAAILVTSVLSLAMFVLIVTLEKLMLPWHARGSKNRKEI